MNKNQFAAECKRLESDNIETVNDGLLYDVFTISPDWNASEGLLDVPAIQECLNGIESASLAQEYRDKVATETQNAITIGDRPNHPRPAH